MGFDFAETSCVLGSRLARLERMQRGTVLFIQEPPLIFMYLRGALVRDF
jgi:hypothetical protein